MANRMILPQDFLNYDFVAMAKHEPKGKNRLRLLAMAHIKEGKPLTQIASSLKVHWKTIQSWIAQFRLGGIANLYVKIKKMKPRKINSTIDSWIKQFIDQLNCSNQGGYITGKQLHHLIEKEFSIKCCLRSVYNALHRLNFSWITSRSKHPKSDVEVQELYKKLSNSTKITITCRS